MAVSAASSLPRVEVRFEDLEATEKDFAELQKRLKTLRGKFILSLNDVPEVRKLFRAFHIRSVKTTYTAQRKAGNRYDELLITNYK